MGLWWQERLGQCPAGPKCNTIQYMKMLVPVHMLWAIYWSCWNRCVDVVTPSLVNVSRAGWLEARVQTGARWWRGAVLWQRWWLSRPPGGGVLVVLRWLLQGPVYVWPPHTQAGPVRTLWTWWVKALWHLSHKHGYCYSDVENTSIWVRILRLKFWA